jgi:hypothetical protein
LHDVGVLRADIAIACCRSSDSAPPTQLYPDPDLEFLGRALEELGASWTAVAWGDPSIDWGSFSRILVSSTWDSVDRPTEYLTWTNSVSTTSVLVNSNTVITWALDKEHQRLLADRGVPIIPTTWVRADESFQLPDGEFVVKPSISAGGRSTARYDRTHRADAAAHLAALQMAGQTVMVQAYLPSVDEQGELDVIVIDGVYSHAVRKRPALNLGEGIVERPWERMAWSGLATPTADELMVVERTVAVISDHLQECPTYARVDLVADADGAPLLLEVELIDPYLSLDLAPAAAASGLAHAIMAAQHPFN